MDLSGAFVGRADKIHCNPTAEGEDIGRNDKQVVTRRETGAGSA
jgi:hypothetical protein